jgi:3-hydroxyisobutyrate dehydrogenase-like beta-hydroxyacid dehydrogenase
MAVQKVGLLSPGDMGHVVGGVLLKNSMPVITCLDGRSDRTRELAKKAGIELVATYEQLVQDADLILSILVPSEAGRAAEKVARALRNTQERIVYVDCNAIAPSTVKLIAEMIQAAGSHFVDAGIIGPPPREKGTTRFYASGSEAGCFEALAANGLDVRIIGTEVGQASGIKMTYAALTKGTIALTTELLVAAWRMGLFESLKDEFRLSQAARLASMEKGLPPMPTKSRRWIGEMEEIAKTFEDLGLTPRIYLGAADVYRFVGQTELAEETPETRDKNRTLAQMIEILAGASQQAS